MSLNIVSVNTILYCRQWTETVEFYEHKLKFNKHRLSDWLIEFKITNSMAISLANEDRTSVKSVSGQGITITWQVDNIEESRCMLKQNGIHPETIKPHSLGGRLFRFYDPEGHRLEIWSK